ncbi:hypothetical protein [Leisingera sp. ANG-M7]|uniref:hypothetical protein n=1 Tax=Leisingera sp. ANG-M7 TaxID=1577902 RepID=UPI00057DC220|nr:hypothetical protein [Leisingera sp. ANG-M7]KIC37237.1 hypothetical protein RA26_08050 [Leisingera sp. ANG-M7]
MDLLERLAEIEWRFYATVVAAFLTFALTQISLFLVRRSDARRQVRSLQVALAAELRSAVQQNGEAQDPEEFKKIINMEIAKINAYTFPSMRREIFEKNCDKIGSLPIRVADAVVEAYGAIDLWNRFANHLKTEEFKSADDATQMVMIKYFVQVNSDVHRTSNIALEQLVPN